MAKFRKIAVLTSGGDAPGMNAAVRAVVNSAIRRGVEVVGSKRGYSGLLENDLVPLTGKDVANIACQGGTFLYSDRCLEFKTLEGMAKALKCCADNEIDGVIAIGGDGTFRGATDLSDHGIPTIGIPATIDNDITSTDHSIGFDTAVNTVIEMADRFRDTCESHARCNVIEVMGRWAGDIAINAGIACGAVATVILEAPFDEATMMAKINRMKDNGQRSFIVIVAEGVENFSEGLAKRIQEQTGVETKFARLAHVVRGGNPTVSDRVLAARLGDAAVEELFAGKSDLVICERKGDIISMNIQFALIMDRLYKGKLKDGDLDKYSAEEIAIMEARCEELKAKFAKLYDIVDEITQ